MHQSPDTSNSLSSRYRILTEKLANAEAPLPRAEVLKPLIDWPMVRNNARMQLKKHTNWHTALIGAKGFGYAFAGLLLIYEMREWQDDRVTRSWQLLTTKAPGNSGKVAALEYLNSEFFCLPGGFAIPLIGPCWKERTSLTGIDLSSLPGDAAVYLQRVNLAGADLSHAKLARADLSEANLTDTYLWKVDFSNADLSYTNLSGGFLDDVDWSNTTKFRCANLSGAYLPETNLSNKDFAAANFTGSDLSDVDFSNTDLQEANLSNADLSNTNLSNANLFNTELSGADLYGITLSEKTNIEDSWAFENSPPRNASEEVRNAISLRKQGEGWSDKNKCSVRGGGGDGGD